MNPKSFSVSNFVAQPTDVGSWVLEIRPLLSTHLAIFSIAHNLTGPRIGKESERTCFEMGSIALVRSACPTGKLFVKDSLAVASRLASELGIFDIDYAEGPRIIVSEFHLGCLAGAYTILIVPVRHGILLARHLNSFQLARRIGEENRIGIYPWRCESVIMINTLRK